MFSARKAVVIAQIPYLRIFRFFVELSQAGQVFEQRSGSVEHLEEEVLASLLVVCQNNFRAGRTLVKGGGGRKDSVVRRQEAPHLVRNDAQRRFHIVILTALHIKRRIRPVLKKSHLIHIPHSTPNDPFE